MKYLVNVNYKGHATVEVEADNEVAAEEIAISEVKSLSANLHVMDVSMQSFGAHAERSV